MLSNQDPWLLNRYIILSTGANYILFTSHRFHYFIDNARIKIIFSTLQLSTLILIAYKY